MGVVCIAELIYECCVFLCVSYICNAWFVYCVLFMRVCTCSTISDHLAIK